MKDKSVMLTRSAVRTETTEFRKTRRWYQERGIKLEDTSKKIRVYKEIDIVNWPFVKYYGSVIYTTTFEDTAFFSDEILKYVEQSQDDIIPLGFDMEWPFSFKTGPGRTALIQICLNKRICYLFHVPLLEKLPAALIVLLSHKRVRLCGVNIRNDIHKLGRDFSSLPKEEILENCIDSRTQAKEVSNGVSWSMEKLVHHFLNMRIDKNKSIRMSQWNTIPLSEEQQKYAAIDAYTTSEKRMSANRIVQVMNIGKLRYGEAWNVQKQIAKNHGNANNPTPNTLLIVEHEPVYTIGIRTKDYTKADKERLISLGAEFYRTDRGGLITFHGPGQLVAYPILNLKHFKPSLKWYVCTIEQTIIDVCRKLKLRAETSPHTGVWIGDNKVCAIGIHGKRFITTHGLALNCNVDLNWYKHIIPCGIHDKGVTSLSKELHTDFGIENALPLFLDSFSKFFDCKLVISNNDSMSSTHL